LEEDTGTLNKVLVGDSRIVEKSKGC